MLEQQTGIVRPRKTMVTSILSWWKWGGRVGTPGQRQSFCSSLLSSNRIVKLFETVENIEMN